MLCVPPEIYKNALTVALSGGMSFNRKASYSSTTYLLCSATLSVHTVAPKLPIFHQEGSHVSDTVPDKEGDPMSAINKIESLESLRDRLRDFAKEREWDQYHTPKNLSMALIAEAAELVEHFQWVEGDKSHLLEDKTRQSVEEELADILIYLVRISDKLEVDLYKAVERKIAINEKKYPAEKVRGSAKKYTEYD